MDTGKLISTLALIGSVATAVAVPLADIKPVYGTVAGLGAAVVGAIGKGLIDVKGTSLLTALGVIVAVSAAIVNFADVQTILSPQVLSVITHVGAIAAALGKGLMGGSDDPPVGGAGGGTKSAFALVLVCLVLPVSLSGCWGGKTASSTRRVIEQLDNNAIAAREIPTALSELLTLGLIQRPTARSFGEKSEAFRAANKQVIDFFDQPEFKAVNADGKVVITLTPAGKVKAEELSKNLVATARAIVADKSLFTNLTDSTRASLSALFSAAGNTADSLIKLVNALKVSQGKTTTIIIPADEWRQFQHAKEVAAYGF